jgi:hypothetical protein
VVSEALIFIAGVVIGILVDWLISGLLPPFNKRNASVVLIVIVVLLGIVVWRQPRDSVTVSVPTDMPLRSALNNIVESRGSTATYSAECESIMETAILREGTITAGNLEQVLELAQHRLAGGNTKVRYSVTLNAERGLYEIRCY